MRAPNRRQLLGELLIGHGLISQDQLEAALLEQQGTGESLGSLLIRRGVVTEDKLLPVLAGQHGIAYVRVRDIEVQRQALAKVPATFASRYTILPLRVDEQGLQVALADPFDVQTLDELRLLLDCDIQPVLASRQEIREAIQRHYGLGASAIEQLLNTGGRTTPASTSMAEDLSTLVDETSIVSFVNQLLLQAVKDRATDIHIEPYETSMRIRERVDGVLYEMPIPQDLVKLHQVVVSRVKVMAKLDIAEKRLPQDGRIKVRLPAPHQRPGSETALRSLNRQRERVTDESGNHHIDAGPTRPEWHGTGGEYHEGGVNEDELDLRVSILPTGFGEAVDIRILSTQMLYSLEQLGLALDHRQLLSQLIERPHGIVFVTGPTGSGKTTTLYACLAKLNAPHRKIITIEDPIEYQLQGITQIQVHPKIGLSFAQGLRSMLRHDPDIMMVGEVRDPETAEITIRSALTGHLVFSTLHTNDAAGGVTRLLDMGIEPFLVASSVLGFIAQRLVRVVCPACQEPQPTPPTLREQFSITELPATLLQGRGCPTCKGTGYKGRTAIYEFLMVDEAIQQLILRRASAHEIRRAAQQTGPPAVPGGSTRAGMRTLRQDGWSKIVQGRTTPQEVLRVT